MPFFTYSALRPFSPNFSFAFPYKQSWWCHARHMHRDECVLWWCAQTSSDLQFLFFILFLKGAIGNSYSGTWGKNEAKWTANCGCGAQPLALMKLIRTASPLAYTLPPPGYGLLLRNGETVSTGCACVISIIATSGRDVWRKTRHNEKSSQVCEDVLGENFTWFIHCISLRYREC